MGTAQLTTLRHGAAIFVAGLALLVMLAALWSRVLARHTRPANLYRSVQRFQNAMFAARMLIPLWFAFAIYALGWGRFIDRGMDRLYRLPIELPGLIVGTFPAFVAWAALWWAQFPADRALREQNMLAMIDDDLPVHTPPGFWSFFIANLRLQLLFTIVPVTMIILIHDIASMIMLERYGIDLRNPSKGSGEIYELLLQFGSIAIVLLFAPELLRRVLHTQRLEDSPLRERLERLCELSRLKYRDILLWRTNNVMGNAAVMGIIPRMRYILLSDVLLESMTDEQIEAVFAHEIGHVKHWHMGWYAVIVATAMTLLFASGQILDLLARHWPNLETMLSNETLGTFIALLTVGTFFFVFGALSRRFERQADVYAARTMQRYVPMQMALATVPERSSYVGQQGADLFIDALHRVAVINNIPLEPARPVRRGFFAPLSRLITQIADNANNYFHGSIYSRMAYLRALSADPSLTARFDRSMFALYACILLTLAICGGWALISVIA